MTSVTDILSGITLRDVPNFDETWGPWDWNKKSLAVIASHGGDGAVLWWVGGHLDYEISEGYASSLGDLGLDNAPNGICVWEGVYDYHSDKSYYDNDGGYTEANGEFRVPTDEEWEYIRENRCPWDANDWMKEKHMQASIGRIVHYTPTQEQASRWGEVGSTVTDETVFSAMVVKTGEEDKANLRVFLDSSHPLPWLVDVEKSEEAGKSGFWSWPPRV